MIRFPAPLKPGDVVGVTSPSSGVDASLRPRLDLALRRVREAGYEVRVGACMDGAGLVSAPKDQRATELTAMLLDPAVRAIVPPWGGETAIDLVDLVDWDAVAAAEPTWVVGYSDLSTLLTPLTLLTGVATVHGGNLMDTPLHTPSGLVGWLDLVARRAGDVVEQTSPGRWARGGLDYRAHPEADEHALDRPGEWARFDDLGGPLDVRGRLIGGCIETISPLAGTPYGDVSRLAGPHIVYLEAAEADAPVVCRSLHGLRLGGFFDRAVAVLIGRTAAPDHPALSQRDAVIDALGTLGIPILGDVECGHVAPRMMLVNGATARVEHGRGRSVLTQTLA